MPLSVEGLQEIGAPLGAGIVHLPSIEECPVTRTAAIAEFLAGESAGRCGPCRFGLPSLADAVQRLATGAADRTEVDRLAALVNGRGACAHPDGTVRLVRSHAVRRRRGGRPACARALRPRSAAGPP